MNNFALESSVVSITCCSGSAVDCAIDGVEGSVIGSNALVGLLTVWVTNGASRASERVVACNATAGNDMLVARNATMIG